MSSRIFLPPFSVVTNGSMGADVTSAITNIQQLGYVSYSLVWTGTPVGDFEVQVSNDYKVDPSGAVLNAGTWTPLALSASVSAAGSPDNAFIDIDGVSAAWVRLVYDRTSGTGTLNATVAGKVI